MRPMSVLRLVLFMSVLAAIACVVASRSDASVAFKRLFGFAMPNQAGRVVYIEKGALDAPRFEFKLSTEAFDEFSDKLGQFGYGPWVEHKYDRAEPVSVLERFLYGYADGKSVFYVSEFKGGKTRKSLIYDPEYQVFIAIHYR